MGSSQVEGCQGVTEGLTELTAMVNLRICPRRSLAVYVICGLVRLERMSMWDALVIISRPGRRLLEAETFRTHFQ